MSFYPPSTIVQLTVGTSPVQLTADAVAAVTALKNGIILTQPNTNGATANIYWGTSNTVSTSTGMLISNPGQISPASVKNIGDIWFRSDTAGQKLSAEIVGQTVTIS